MSRELHPGATRLDSYVDRYAARTRGMTASEIRALFAVASRPEVVSLAGGMPNISGLPLDVVGAAIHDLVRDHGAVAMQYGSGQGDPRLREQICDVMRREAPSYVGALGVFRAYECDVVHVAMDDDGLVPVALRDAIASVRAAGRRIKFLYTIPNFHNPAGVSLSAERRQEVLDICRDADVLVLEDNPYGLLGFDAEPQRAMRADEAEGVIYLGSFSKTFAPGFRVGWALAPHTVREKLVLAQESATLCPPSFSQMAVSAYLEKHDWQGQIKQFREMYRERRDAMVAALDDLMPAGCRWNVPTGGFYVWLTLPPGIDAKAMLPRAVTARVAYVPGTAFYADGFGSSSMRLSFCYPTPERIHEGVRRLAGVLESEMELRATFGATGDAHEHALESRGYEGPNTDLT